MPMPGIGGPRRSTRTLIASDWHLASFSPPGAASLAERFLRRAQAAGDRVVLNGDIFEGLFEPAHRAEAAHPAVRDLVVTMVQDGQLVRTAGNHDPDAGPLLLVLTENRLGRVLVAHGHAVDPLHRSGVGRLGDAVSHHFGRVAAVRGAAHLAAWTALHLAGTRIERLFQTQCRALVEAERCALGVFGHIHRCYLASADRYANAGCLASGRLEYLVLEQDTAELRYLDLQDRETCGGPVRIQPAG